MRYWSYIIKNKEGRVMSEYQEPGISREQDARRGAVKAMRAMLRNGSRQPDGSLMVVLPFTLVLTIHTDMCPPLSMGRETYSEKEVLEYGIGEDLSLGELLSIAKDNYARGGDTVYECWDQPYYDTYVSMFGPVRRKDTAGLFGSFR